jgi:hypothetical protein
MAIRNFLKKLWFKLNQSYRVLKQIRTQLQKRVTINHRGGGTLKTGLFIYRTISIPPNIEIVYKIQK